jgi:hypothetical protein
MKNPPELNEASPKQIALEIKIVRRHTAAVY